MPRYYFDKKQEADYLKKVEMWWLKKHGYLNGWKSGRIEWKNEFADEKSSIGIEVCIIEGYVRFFYTQTEENGEKKQFDYKAQLATTPCHYGGARHWFICPLIKNGQPCGRRVGVLYKAGNYFGCRHCYNLTYAKQNKNRKGYFNAFGQYFDKIAKAEELADEIKREYYAGKPTRKFRQLLKIHDQAKFYGAIALQKNP